jgi:hypothetical protein
MSVNLIGRYYHQKKFEYILNYLKENDLLNTIPNQVNYAFEFADKEGMEWFIDDGLMIVDFVDWHTDSPSSDFIRDYSADSFIHIDYGEDTITSIDFYKENPVFSTLLVLSTDAHRIGVSKNYYNFSQLKEELGIEYTTPSHCLFDVLDHDLIGQYAHVGDIVQLEVSKLHKLDNEKQSDIPFVAICVNEKGTRKESVKALKYLVDKLARILGYKN